MKNAERQKQAKKYLDFLTEFMEGQVSDRNGNTPDEADRMIAAGIAFAFENARKQTGIIPEELLCLTCERFFGDRWLAVIHANH